jgi:hypothetical protein
MICIGLFVRCTGSAQVSSLPPRNWRGAASIDLSLASRLKLSHNSPDAVREELWDTNTLRVIAGSCGLADQDLATVHLVQNPGSKWLEIYQTGKSGTAFRVLSEQLKSYVRAREEGHTKEFVLAALTNRVSPSTISDPALRAIATNQPLLPVSWLKKTESRTTTHKATKAASPLGSTTVIQAKETTPIAQVDEVCSRVSYALVDGEVAWQYLVQFKADGSLDYIREEKCDAKEYDTKYQTLVKDADEEAQAEMKRRQEEDVQIFWQLKKEKLKAKGIDWQTPAELNPK